MSSIFDGKELSVEAIQIVATYGKNGIIHINKSLINGDSKWKCETK